MNGRQDLWDSLDRLTPETLTALLRRHFATPEGAVSEGAIRYHLRRQGAQDGRKGKPRKADHLAQVIDDFLDRSAAVPDGRPDADAARPGNVLALFEHLQREHLGARA